MLPSKQVEFFYQEQTFIPKITHQINHVNIIFLIKTQQNTY